MAQKTEMLRVRNWRKFQHYKDRTPPWIKLHWELLSSEDWVMLADASRLLAVVCMLIASRNEGLVPNNPAYIKRVAYLDKAPDLKPLIECGFLENPLADDSGRKRMQADDTTEAETDKNNMFDSSETGLNEHRPTASEPATPKAPANGNGHDVDAEFPEWYAAYPRHTGRKAAEKAYRAARKKHERHFLLAEAKAAAVRYASTEARFIPHPATWLNGERWDDDEAAPQPAGGYGGW